MPIEIGVREQLGEKEELKNLELSGWIKFIWGEINLNVLGFEICRHFEIRWIPRYPREIVKWGFWLKITSFDTFVVRLAFYARLGSPKITISLMIM